MLVSAESRWFWRESDVPPGLEAWFMGTASSSPAHPFPPGGGGRRTDDYLRDPGQTELGIKARGGKAEVEVKGLVNVNAEGMPKGPFAGPLEIWTKWDTKGLSLATAPQVSTEKTRYLRKFDTTGAEPVELPLRPDEKLIDQQRPLPAAGCHVELTRVTALGKSWWTFSFEAFGTLATIVNDARAVAVVMAARHPPQLVAGIRINYPVWLKTQVLGE